MRQLTIPKAKQQETSELICRFLDELATSSGGAKTHYDSGIAQREAGNVLHESVFSIDRGLYAAMLALPGVRDGAKRPGILCLLGNKIGSQFDDESFIGILTAEQERDVIKFVVDSLPTQRLVKLFGDKKDSVVALKINNARTRKLCLKSLLGRHDLTWVAVKYREKMAMALTHAWGTKMTSAIKEIVSIDHVVRNFKELGILEAFVLKYTPKELDKLIVLEAIRHIFGLDQNQVIADKTINAFHRAKAGDVTALKDLPQEVAMGLKEQGDFGTVEVYQEAKATTRQTARSVKAMDKVGVTKDVNYNNLDMAEIFVLGFETGFNETMNSAIEYKATKAAARLPLSYNKIGIIIDASYSMMGGQQKWRPYAIARSVAAVLKNCSQQSPIVVYAGGKGDDGNMMPDGPTDLASALVEMAGYEDVDAVFVISDGFENRQAGRFAEVLAALRRVGWNTTVTQLTPVLSAKAFMARPLANGLTVMPVTDNIESLGLGVIKATLLSNFDEGIKLIMSTTKNLLSEGR